MKWSGIAAAMLLAVTPIAAAQQSSSSTSPSTSASASGGRITLQGCVRPGVDKDQVIVTDAMEIAAAGKSALPAEAHGRKVIFWLDRDDALKPLLNRKVEVAGTQGKIEKSEIELKAGHQKEGGLVLEFEGPGRDVKASNDVVGQPLGTSGRAAAGNSDIKDFLVHVKVDSVRQVSESCN